MRVTKTRIIYNGVDLMMVKTHEFNMGAVYDESMTDYLFTRVTGIWEGLINGQARIVDMVPGANGPFMSYDFQGSGLPPFNAPGGTYRTPVTPIAFDPNMFPAGYSAGINIGTALTPARGILRLPNAPPLTHAAIRHRLSTPRKYLYIFSGPGTEFGIPAGGDDPPPDPAILCVESPYGQFICDCKNGPIPKLLSVTEAVGDANTFAVTWAVETYINEANFNEANPRGSLLSNRFSQSHTVDDSGYTTIQTQGTAIFRTDLLYANNTSPDAFRALLFMPIPQGFVRKIEPLHGREDVTGVDYVYTDTQVPVNFVAGPYAQAATITVAHSQAISSDVDILGGALSAYERILAIKVNKRFAGPDAPKMPVPLPARLRGGARPPIPPRPAGP